MYIFCLIKLLISIVLLAAIYNVSEKLNYIMDALSDVRYLQIKSDGDTDDCFGVDSCHYINDTI